MVKERERKKRGERGGMVLKSEKNEIKEIG